MEKNLPIHLQEIIFGSANPTISKKISKLEKSGKIRKIAPRLYTGNLEDKPETIVRRNIFTILGKLFPGAILSHRSALEFQPTTTNQLFLTYSYTRKTKLPGITIRFLAGKGAIDGDYILSLKRLTRQRESDANIRTLSKAHEFSATIFGSTMDEIQIKLERSNAFHTHL